MKTSSLTLKEKVGYGLGDMASALVWQTATIFLAYFYTDVFGLPAAIMGTMFLLVRIFDAFADPCIGLLVDRTHSRHGRFRPWLMWFAVPFGVSCLITFYVPDIGLTGKIIYASVTYTLLSFIYSAINVPYCAMPGAMTLNPRERHSLQSYRFALSFIGGLLVTVVALPLVNVLGQGNIQKGYFYAMGLMGTLGVFLFYCCFFMTKEKYSTESHHHSIFNDLKLLMTNSQWRLIIIFIILLLTGVVVRGSATIYFVKYVLHRPDDVFLFIVSGMVAAMAGALLSEPLLGRFDKVIAFKWTIISYVIVGSVIFLVPSEYFWTVFFINIVFNFVQNLCTPVQWAMVSDVVDYEEHRSGHRLNGLIFSTSLFAIKFGLALGGAIVGWLLGIINYQPNNITQNEFVTSVISGMFTLVPSLIFIIMGLLLFWYKLNNEYVSVIASERKYRSNKVESTTELTSTL